VAQYTLGLTRTVGHGRAFTQRSSIPSPAVATGFTYTNDGGYWELGDSLSFQLATDSNAANRVVTLTIKDADGVALATIPAANNLTASKTGLYTYLGTLSTINGAADGPFTAPFPQIWLQPRYEITVAFTNAQAGDQISAIRFVRQRFVTGNEGYLLGVFEEDDPRFQRYLATETVLG